MTTGCVVESNYAPLGLGNCKSWSKINVCSASLGNLILLKICAHCCLSFLLMSSKSLPLQVAVVVWIICCLCGNVNKRCSLTLNVGHQMPTFHESSDFDQGNSYV